MNKTKVSARGIGLLLPAAWLAWCLFGSGDPPPSAADLSDPEPVMRAPAASRPEPLSIRGAEPTARARLPETDPPPAGFAVRGVEAEPDSAATPAGPVRVRVTVRLPAGAPDCGLPVPELLRIDARGVARPVADPAPAPSRHPALELAMRTARGEPARAADEASRVFEVREPGLYAAAWHVWAQVPGTRTWRVQRGRGPELLLSGSEETREIVVHVGAESLRLDASLDAKPQNPHYRFTAKDG